MDSGQKGRTSFIIMAVALALTACMAILSLGAAVYLIIDGTSAKSEIRALQSKVDGLGADLKAVELLQADVDSMKKSASGENEQLPTFSVSSFDLDHSTSDYTESYSGNGTVTCSDEGTYLVLLKQTLESGGSPTAERVQYIQVTVAAGKGLFYTYDWADTGKLQKPDYKFDILSYVRTTPVK